jgi:hypothetical protein
MVDEEEVPGVRHALVIDEEKVVAAVMASSKIGWWRWCSGHSARAVSGERSFILPPWHLWGVLLAQNAW